MFEGAVTTYDGKKLKVKNHKTSNIEINYHKILIIIKNTYNNNNSTYYDCKNTKKTALNKK